MIEKFKPLLDYRSIKIINIVWQVPRFCLFFPLVPLCVRIDYFNRRLIINLFLDFCSLSGRSHMNNLYNLS